MLEAAIQETLLHLLPGHCVSCPKDRQIDRLCRTDLHWKTVSKKGSAYIVARPGLPGPVEAKDVQLHRCWGAEEGCLNADKARGGVA